MSEIKLIYARAANGVIGQHGKMPWHLPEDLLHFKRLTLGCPVIMGRKTWDSLPSKYRPLPGRLNVVVTRQSRWRPDASSTHHDGVRVAHALDAAITLCQNAAVIWIIGGAEIYAQALPLATEALVTEIDQVFEGDAFAPLLDETWMEVARQMPTAPSPSSSSKSAQGLSTTNKELQYAFVTYRRQTAGTQ